MVKEEVLDKLKAYDTNSFKFESKRHRYTFDNERYISVTQFISRFHKEFDSEHWSKVKAEERGISQDDILKEWKELNERSLVIGSGAHGWIENYFKETYQSLPTDIDIIDRINKFNIIYSKQLHKLTPVKFEQRIFSKKWKIAGMIDSIFINPKGEVVILDWKTNKSFDTDKTKTWSKLLNPFNEYWENHLNEYSIQVSLYSIILEEIGIDVKSAFLVHIGPHTEAKLYKALDMKDILIKYLDSFMGDLPF